VLPRPNEILDKTQLTQRAEHERTYLILFVFSPFNYMSEEKNIMERHAKKNTSTIIFYDSRAEQFIHTSIIKMPRGLICEGNPGALNTNLQSRLSRQRAVCVIIIVCVHSGTNVV